MIVSFILILSISISPVVDVFIPNISPINYATVSWYGYRFHNRLTANGEIFNPDSLTFAHRDLSFNTIVRFINPDTGQSIVARCNDRGPFVKGREFDLSRETFSRLADLDIGLLIVQYEILGEYGWMALIKQKGGEFFEQKTNIKRN